MIQLNSAKMTLSLILPNTNKALKQVIQDATPKELKELSRSKDLKSVLNSIFKKSSQDSNQNKTLLTLVKNNPTLKELSNPIHTAKELVKQLEKSIKEEQKSTSNANNLADTKITPSKEKIALQNTTLQNTKETLNKFLNDIKDIDNKTLSTKIENSGVFLESKIKTLQTPKMNLKLILQDLSKQLDTTQLTSVKTINTQLKDILSSDLFKNINNEELFKNIKPDIKELTQITKNVDNIIDKLNQRLTSNMDKTTNPKDILFKETTKHSITKLQLLNHPEKLSTQSHTKNLFSNDLKSVLLKAQDDISTSTIPNKQELLKQLDKLTLQIDYHQLVSHLSNSSSLYIPYSWDDLEDGEISLKNTQNDSFFCDINLKLKNDGELRLRLGLFQNNILNINITATDNQFKEKLKENMPELKKQLFKIGLTPQDIRFIEDIGVRTSYDDSNQHIDVGFEVKA